MFELARGYRERGMTAYAELQQREFDSEDARLHRRPAPAGGRGRLLRGGRAGDHRRRVRDDRADRLDRGVAVPELKALLFDVFGTCVDWRTSVAREAAALGLPGDAAVADAWRGELPAAARDRAPRRARVGGARRAAPRGARRRARRARARASTPAERDELTLAWHRLDPWPDTVAGPHAAEAALRRSRRAPTATSRSRSTSRATPGCRGTRSSAPRSPAPTSPTRASTARASPRSGSSRARR